MEQYAVIVAGGSGTRMETSTPKQFLLLGGKPVLQHTLEALFQFNPALRIILVLPASQTGRWKELRKEFNCKVPHAVAEGGESRFQSVKNGLALVPPEALVAIHDGVRPFISHEILEQSFSTAAEKGSAVTTVPLKESIRKLQDGGNSEALDRTEFCLVQTPQTFQARAIKQAYRQAESTRFTDCASVAEAGGLSVNLIRGSYRNIKITTPEDLLLAEHFLIKKEL